MKLDEIIEEQNKIHVELERMTTDDSTTEDADGNIRDTLVARWKDLDTDRAKIVARMEELDLIRKASADRDNQEPGDGAAPDRRSPQFMQRMDPFADLDKVKRNLVTGSEMISRSLNAIEYHNKRGLLWDDRAEEATRKAQGAPMIARHMLMTGGDDYIDAFRTYLNDPMGEGQVARANLLTSTATAGYLLPYVLDTQIVLTNSGSTNPYRKIARVVQTTSNAWQGVSSAGVGVAWLAEGSAASDSGSAVSQIQVIPQKAASWVTGSFEVMQDTDYSDQLPTLLGDAKDIAEEAAFALGTGGSTGPNAGQPLGIAVALGTAIGAQRIVATGGTATGAFAGTAGVADVYNLNAGLGPRFRLSPNVAWVANITTINRIRSLDNYGGSSFWTNLGGGQPETLLSKRIEESPSLLSPAGTGTIAAGSAVAIFGDFSKYIICDRIGSTMLFDPMLKGAGTGNIPTGTQGWFYFWRVGANVAAANAFRWIGNF